MLDLVPYGWGDDGLVVAGHVVLGYFSFVAQDRVDGGHGPGLLPQGRGDAILGEVCGDGFW